MSKVLLHFVVVDEVLMLFDLERLVQDVLNSVCWLAAGIDEVGTILVGLCA